jgi:hypothetical protein
MNAEQLTELRSYKWMPSRIPALDALTAFVPEGQEENDLAVMEMMKRVGAGRWHPVAGGHEVLIPYEGGQYDQKRFTIQRGGWDHEHCKICGTNIPPMTECWVTESGKYVVLCKTCYSEVAGSTPPQPPDG